MLTGEPRADKDEAAVLAALPMTAYLVLGVLVINDEELSAAEIKTRADFSFGQFYWAPAVSHIRRELSRLLALDLVSEREVKTGRLRSTVRYQSTEDGEQLLQAWTASLPEHDPVMMKHPMLLRIWFASSTTDPLRLMDALDRHIERTRHRIDELRWGLRRGEELGLISEPRIRYSKPVADYMIRSLYAEIVNCEQLRDDLARDTPRDPTARVTRRPGELHRRPRPGPAGRQ
jgi:DNA-binding PadR family transcriptional regulator